jgi:hypothetical protein
VTPQAVEGEVDTSRESPSMINIVVKFLPALALTLAASSGGRSEARTGQEQSPSTVVAPSGFGARVVCVGDLDKDGWDDLAIAAPGDLWDIPRGRVFVISTARGAPLHDLKGLPGEDVFGGALRVIGSAPGNGPQLGASSLKGGTTVFDLVTGSRIVTLSDVAFIVGTPGDIDGDHVPDSLCDLGSKENAPDTLRWNSGRDWSDLGRKLHVKDGTLLTADFDGDQVCDVLGQGGAGRSECVLLSSATGRPLFQFVPPEADVEFTFRGAVCISPIGHDKPLVVIPAIHRVRKTSYFLAYRPEGQELVAMVAFGSGRHDLEEARFRLFDVGDIDGDAVGDFVAMNTSVFKAEIRAYSGSEMELIWRQKGIVKEGTETLAVLQARGADGNRRPLIAVGCVFVDLGGRFDPDGEVVLLDPKDGKVVKTFREKDYVR